MSVAYVVTPKKSALLVARIAELGDKPAFTWDVPDTDEELAAIVGNGEDGTPKLTFKSLAQEAIATKLQAVFSLKLGEDAPRDADGKFLPEQYVTAETLTLWAKESYAKAYALLVGERAAAAGRKSAEAKAQEKIDADNASKIAVMREQIIAAPIKVRPVLIGMARSFGYNELADEMEAL